MGTSWNTGCFENFVKHKDIFSSFVKSDLSNISQSAESQDVILIELPVRLPDLVDDELAHVVAGLGNVLQPLHRVLGYGSY